MTSAFERCPRTPGQETLPPTLVSMLKSLTRKEKTWLQAMSALRLAVEQTEGIRFEQVETAWSMDQQKECVSRSVNSDSHNSRPS